MGNKINIFNNNVSNKLSKKMQIVMIGLDGAGKTTILYRLKLRENVYNTLPTSAFNVNTVQLVKNAKFLIWDTAGSEELRPLWKAYIRKADGIIFVVDSSNEQRFEEVRVELDNILLTNESKGVPLIILANKQDKRNSLRPLDLYKVLDLDSLDYSVKWNLHPTAGRYGDGLHEAMLQLARMIEENRKLRESRSKSISTNTLNSFETIQNSKFI